MRKSLQNVRSTVPHHSPNIYQPPARTQIDQAAASRFIKHAIAQAKYGRPPGDNAEPTPSEASVPLKITSKMVERAEYEKGLKEIGSEEEEDLRVIDEDQVQVQGGENRVMSNKGKGKQKLVDTMDDDSQAGKKRRRPKMDPFAGKCVEHLFLRILN